MMESEAGRTQASLLLHEYGCCARCVKRMLHGSTCKPEDFITLGSARRETPICPVCCGLLHHPRLCTLPSDYSRSTYQSPKQPEDRNLLSEVLFKMDTSDFEYLACHLQVSELMNHLVREHVIWSRLYDLLTGCSKPTFYDLSWRSKQPGGKITCLFTLSDLEHWRSTRIPAKRVWYWIVNPILSDALKVPIFPLPNEANNPEFVRANNFDSTLVSPETSVLCVNIELFDKYNQEECQEFLEAAVRCAPPPVRMQVMYMLNSGSPKLVRQWLSGSACRNGTGKMPSIRFDVTRSRLLNVFSSMWENAMSPFLSLPEDAYSPVIRSVRLERPVGVVLVGRYVKFSRRLPQTPWIVDQKRKLPSSVEELIVGPIREQFGAGSQFTFISSGREDVDTRCLGLGRPFMLQIEHYEAFVPDVLRSWSVALSKSPDSRPVDLLRLASVINARAGGQMLVRDLQLATATEASKAIKSGETNKSKRYRAVCWCPEGGLTTDMIRRFANQYAALPGKKKTMPPFESLVWPPQSSATQSDASTEQLPYGTLQFGAIQLNQLTPIRVLHRRPQLYRKRNVHSFQLAPYEAFIAQPDADIADYESWSKLYPPEELFIMHVYCEAGTYVKEFVHGDLGRTVPSLSSMFARQIDLLALDVTAVELQYPPLLPVPELSETDSARP